MGEPAARVKAILAHAAEALPRVASEEAPELPIMSDRLDSGF